MKRIESRIAAVERKIGLPEGPPAFLEITDPYGGPPIVVPASPRAHARVVAAVEAQIAAERIAERGD